MKEADGEWLEGSVLTEEWPVAVPLLYWFWVQVGAVAALWLYEEEVYRNEDADFAPGVVQLFEWWHDLVEAERRDWGAA